MGALIATASVLYTDDTAELVQLLNCPMYVTLYVIGSWPLLMAYCIWHALFVYTLELASIHCYCCIMLLMILCMHFELWDQVAACSQPHVMVPSSARYLGSVFRRSSWLSVNTAPCQLVMVVGIPSVCNFLFPSHCR